ncbi:hypothetical protein O0L34_g4239 [Tuta absoluta]|nr:hypothetical protein O0L34_g4239 [Tuta absoluta]
MKKQVVFLAAFLNCYQPQLADCREDVEVQHAPELRRLMNRFVFHQTDGPDTLRNFLFNGVTRPANPLDDFTELNPSNLKKIINIAKQHYARFNKESILSLHTWERKLDFSTRTNKEMSWFLEEDKEKELLNKIKKAYPQNGTSKHNPPRKQKQQPQQKAHNETRRALYNNHYETHEDLYKFIDSDVNRLFIDFMMQSVFQTRYNLRQTLEIRKRYRLDASYRIAIMHTMIVEYLEKIKKLYATVMKFSKNSRPSIKFIYYLIIYEKALQARTDIVATVRRIFDEHHNFMRKKRIKAGLLSDTQKDEHSIELPSYEVEERVEKAAEKVHIETESSE